MVPYEELTRLGRARRMRPIALHVAERHYGHDVSRIRAVGVHSFNSVFRIEADGHRYALRIGEPHRIHARGVEDIETAWLDSLRANGLQNATVVSTKSGGHWVTDEYPAVPGPRICTMFTWVEGSALKQPFDAETMRACGRLLAQLHDQAHAAPSPDAVAVAEVRANRAIYLPPKYLIATHESPEHSMLLEATERVQHVIDSLWRDQPHDPHMLHGDFGPHNVLRYRGRLRPIDFQDLRFGFALQDVGISCSDLARRDPGLVAWFQAGYTEVRPWPQVGPDVWATLAAARSLNIMNLGLFAPHSGIAAAYDAHVDRVRHWMRS